MKNFIDILNIIKNTVPKLVSKPNCWFLLKDSPNYSIRITQPYDFDDYPDIIARITLFHKNTVLWDVLVAQDTDYDKFGQKLLEKIHKHKRCNSNA